MPYLVDSDIVIDHLARVPEAEQLLEKLAEEGIAMSIITYMETYQGVLRCPDPAKAESMFEEFVANVPVLLFSLPVAKRCAHLREQLRKEKRRMKARALDLLNAAIALEYQLTLVTRNTEDYKDIPDLKLYKAS
jgi:predicted nucleic acid-binding protein